MERISVILKDSTVGDLDKFLETQNPKITRSAYVDYAISEALKNNIGGKDIGEERKTSSKKRS